MSNPAAHSQHPGNADERLRVILVGRTGLDRELRRAAGIELMRARTAFDALGELSDGRLDAMVENGAMRHAPDGPIFVLVGQTDDADLEPGGDDGPDFVEALKLIDPAVRTARVVGDDDTDDCGVFDASLRASDGVEAVRAFAKKCEPKPAPARDATRPSARENAAAAASVPPTSADLGDAPLAALLARGQDIVPMAVALMQHRIGNPHLRFVRSATAADKSPDAVPVLGFGDVTIGMLIAPGSSAADAQQQAAWLSSWMRLSDQQRQLREAAFTDPLTGARNRRYFDRFLPAAIDRARDARHDLTLLVFDIDDFKTFNDQHGHAAGDEILRETVRMLDSVVRPNDRVCRIGGDEFAVVFFEPDGPREAGSTHPASVFEIADRFQLQVQSCSFPKLGRDAPGTLAISGGLATFPWDGRTAEDLLRHADQLSYQSKRQGKNVITLGPGARDRRDRPR
ncbi:MAG: GGDEF domain-containing protein [Planctomycetota bacterium]